MTFNRNQTGLAAILGLTVERADELNSLLAGVFDHNPLPETTADIMAIVAPHMNTPEETFYLGYQIGAIVTNFKA